MLKGVVDEHGNGGGMSGAFRLKEAYVKNPKRMGQLLDTFPMSSVLKKVGASLEMLHVSMVDETGFCSMWSIDFGAIGPG